MTTIELPELCLVLLIGPSGAGKSTFAARHFKATEVLSSDSFRGLVCDDPDDQAATADAFELLRVVADKRLARGRLTVIDATSVRREDRALWLTLAKEHDCLAVAIVFDMPEALCHQRNGVRPDRQFGRHVVRGQRQQLRRGLKRLRKDGFRYVHRFDMPEALDRVELQRHRLWTDRRDDHGPFDIIGDIHGCADELESLLQKLGYEAGVHPDGRRVIFLGDLVDRGPRVVDTLKRVMAMVSAGQALCIPGNHDVKLLRQLRGQKVKLRYGLAETVAQLELTDGEFREQAASFIDGLISHYVLDGGQLVVAHAGLAEKMHGRASGRVRSFALYGDVTGETDEYGLPIRGDWAADYRGEAWVVYGHTPVAEPEWHNRTINIDTGCVFGGRLTALRWPEKELVTVPAERQHAEPARPLQASRAALTAQQRDDSLLDLADVQGKRFITTRLRASVTIREENAAAALETISRFGINPKWLIHLPPTMSPCETSQLPGLLEHPQQAFDYYASKGVSELICQRKHMGSRALVLLCRDEPAARKYFGVVGEGRGRIYTRTGRPFFKDAEWERQLLARLHAAAVASELDRDWMLLDCELMPWSAKAEALITRQYAAVATAATAGLDRAVLALEQCPAASDLLTRYRQRAELAQRYAVSYLPYCWPVDSIDDLQLAPFALLASSEGLHLDQDHRWQMQTLAQLCAQDPQLLLATEHRYVQSDDPASREAATAWWTEMTSSGGEGMVVKPLSYIARGKRDLVQPAVKCRGPEYLRIIYGPEYDAPEHLERLRKRGLGHKRSLALREFALGIEALERFVAGEPLRRVHECVFGLLALESEPVDSRL